jgi:hypothetical protein
MNSTPLEYASAPVTRGPLRYIARGRRFPWKRIVLGLLILVALICAWTVEVSTDDLQIDAVTGTMFRKTSWRFGFTTGERIDASPLEIELKKRGIPWTPNWCFLNSNGQNIMGLLLYRGCSNGPPILGMKPILQPFVAKATDAELREFVQVMQSGTDDQQKAAVDAAAEKVFDDGPVASKLK